jgi:hypothetical protein
MKHIARLLLVLALTATLASAHAVSSYAGGRDVAGPAVLQANATSGPTQDSWAGGVAAIGCGFGLRTGGFGGSPWGIGATGILCLFMIVDGIRS